MRIRSLCMQTANGCNAISIRFTIYMNFKFPILPHSLRFDVCRSTSQRMPFPAKRAHTHTFRCHLNYFEYLLFFQRFYFHLFLCRPIKMTKWISLVNLLHLTRCEIRLHLHTAFRVLHAPKTTTTTTTMHREQQLVRYAWCGHVEYSDSNRTDSSFPLHFVYIYLLIQCNDWWDSMHPTTLRALPILRIAFSPFTCFFLNRPESISPSSAPPSRTQRHY